DTIIVRDGTYTENVDVNKSLTIALAHNPTVTEFPICTDPAGQANPAISGDIVVWTDYRNGNADIYGYDLSTNTEFPICTDPAGQANPAISGNIVVWRDDRNYYSTGLDIYGYDLSTDAEFPICTDGAWQQHPAISGDIVVWMDKRNGNQDIYGYNLSSQEELEVYTEPTWQGYPAISGNIVVWWDCVLVDHSLTSCDIYGYDLSTGTECAICTHPSYQYHPAISGDIVVWMDSRGVDIYGYNLSTDTEFPICTDPAGQNVPAISGNIVVWTDFRNYYSTGIDIYGYDLSTDAEFPICTDLAGQHGPAISGDIVVWMDDRGGNSDIYGARFDVIDTEPPTCAIELQKNGIPIDKINVEEFFDIYVGDSTDDTGIKEVRFSSDDSQDGIPTGEWTEWYDWDTSSGDWNAETKIKKWSFATGGKKEVWAEINDSVGQISNCSANIYAIIVAPLRKTVTATHEAIFEPATAEMTISYNWFGQDENGEDIYVISQVDCTSQWFVGYYEVSFESPSGTIWNHKIVTPFNKHGSPLDFGTLYLPSRETSEGIKVHACEWISVKAYGVTEVEMLSIISIVGEIVMLLPPIPPSPPFFSESATTYIAPDWFDTSDCPPIVVEEIEILPETLGHLCSPGELRIYDSQGRVTGLLNGKIKQEIPDSAYFNGSFVILSPSNSYRYEVVGTEAGTYDLGVISIEVEKVNAFGAADIPISPNAIHQYTIDWDALYQGEEGVTVQVDSDGDGEFEDTFTADGELTYDEFMLQTATTIDFDPDTLNLQSEGKWVTTYIELSEGSDVSAITVSTVMLNDQLQAEIHPTEIGDYDDDGIADLMVKFDWSAVQEILEAGDEVEITVTGELTEGTPFEGSDVIRVIDQS
ncbi:MAG: hypothetical protein KAT65_13415, partial [Methanophagales archaeon]|nr:hypothetical protein [Methanophagales archaeon]